MRVKEAKIVFGVGLLALSFLIPNLLWGQAAGLSGAITDPAGKAVANATISAKNVETGQSVETETDSDGLYNLPNLAPGDYTVSASAKGFGAKEARVAIVAAKQQRMNLTLNAVSGQQEIPGNKLPGAPTPNLPNAPSSSPAAPSLQDLGFPSTQTKGSAQEQALLNRRTHMLKVHQTLGLITAVPMVATLITGPQAKAKGKNGQTITEPTQANLDFHIALGGLTTGLYFTTAYYAIFAPQVQGVKPKGAIRLHRDLEWVHGPGMILTPVLGIMAYKQENAGEKVHGIASAHGTAAYVTAAAYGASIVAVSWPIHWKFWEGR